MSIITRGYGNGTFDGSIRGVVLMGFFIGEDVIDLVALNATPDLTLAGALNERTLHARLNEKTLYSTLNASTLQGQP